MSNAGDRIAFYGVDYTSGFTTEMYIVTPGDPSSWVKLTTGFPEIPNRLISWTPDDSGFYAGPYFTNATTGAVTTPTVFGYNPDDSSLTTLPADNWLVTQVVSSIVGEQVEVDYIRVVGTPYLYEFNTDGDTEGWQATAGYSSLVVASGTMTGDISTNDPILSSVTFGAPIDASVTNTISIRMRPSVRAFGELYWITSADPAENSSKRVRFDSGPAGSFNDITIDLSTHPNWTGNVTDLRIDLVSSTRDLVALPILANGQEDTGRSPVAITNIDGPDLVGNVDWQVIAPDGSALAFVDYAGSQVAGIADHADIYLIEDLQDILSGSQPAITSLTDPRVKEIRVAESPNFAHTPTISQDGSLVLYGEDFNNLFRNDDFF
ncbi:MAG TPA: hypothetical protein PLJ47_16480, partial [Candidatus Hydrogenedentes bacterium]|nr:hypothetical protein [Candidatus Hydrogenedentota bacterium]